MAWGSRACSFSPFPALDTSTLLDLGKRDFAFWRGIVPVACWWRRSARTRSGHFLLACICWEVCLSLCSWRFQLAWGLVLIMLWRAAWSIVQGCFTLRLRLRLGYHIARRMVRKRRISRLIISWSTSWIASRLSRPHRWLLDSALVVLLLWFDCVDVSLVYGPVKLFHITVSLPWKLLALRIIWSHSLTWWCAISVTFLALRIVWSYCLSWCRTTSVAILVYRTLCWTISVTILVSGVLSWSIAVVALSRSISVGLLVCRAMSWSIELIQRRVSRVPLSRGWFGVCWH